MNPQKITIVIMLLYSFRMTALNIHEVHVTQTDTNRLLVRLYTEADELYYYQNWQYSIHGSEILLEVLFMPGFGSKIAYLNNNFELYFNENLNNSYKLTVKVYYAVFSQEQLQDSLSGFLFFPMIDSVSLKNQVFNSNTNLNCFDLSETTQISVFDISNKLILKSSKSRFYNVLKELEPGFYIVVSEKESKLCVQKIIVKK